ncbi:MAG: 1,4-alpha-glucan branching protein GlgB [Deltaproteobacteria bacterium]|nr:1,4-alpha-glucan branching protein GlgB [Deltaproteobacteria bacterium]
MKHPRTTLSEDDIKGIVSGSFADPFSILGAHPITLNNKNKLAVRVFLPNARSVRIKDLLPGEERELLKVDNAGLFEGIFPLPAEIFPYRLKVDFGSGLEATFYDCYSFLPIISEYDLYLFGQGKNYEIYEKLGAHPWKQQGVRGILFAVWAPSARRVSVLGDFNQWDGRRNQMRCRGGSGVWELFIPHIEAGQIYKFEIKSGKEEILIKADPFAFRFERRPKTAAVVHDLNNYKWKDQEWMAKRGKRNPLKEPMSIYEVHLGSWRRKAEDENRWLTYREAAEELVGYVKETGFNFIEFLPLTEHPFDGSWGYQVTGYFAATSRYGAPDDLMYLIDRCHREGIGVIMDWVPAHFPKDPHALEHFDGTKLFEHADPRQAEQKDWKTLVFNYGRNEVKNFLMASALFWLDKYHVDGLRFDAVASMIYLDYSKKEGEWIPNRFGGKENLEAIEFLKDLNCRVYERFEGVMTIAEESTSWPGVTLPVHLGGLGFLFKWNMGWMHDMLTYMSNDPIYRRFHMNMLTFALLYAFHENFILPLSHDEVVHGKASLLSKMPGDEWQKFANLRLLLGYMYGEPGKKMLFMGGEFGQIWEWDHDNSLQWHLLSHEPHRKLQRFVKDLNRMYHSEPAMYELDFDHAGFEWIDFRDLDSSIVSFIRRGEDPGQTLIFIFNFTPVPRTGYRIGVPVSGFYREIINSDADCYGGSNFGMQGGVTADEIPWHGKAFSLALNVPPLGMMILKPVI